MPARSSHDLRLVAPGRPRGGQGQPICYGDDVVIKCRGAEEGTWLRLGLTPVRELEPRARALCKHTESRGDKYGEASHVAMVQWGERRTTERQIFRIEGFCDLRGVPIRAGDKFYMRSRGCVREGAPHGCHLQADWDVDWEERVVVGSRGLQRDRMQEMEAFKVGPLRSWINKDCVIKENS